MSTITATPDASHTRIGVELGAWTPDGPVTVYRVHADGSRHEVRSMSDVSGGSAFGWDYEAPILAAVTYEADDATGTISSASATLAASSRSTLTVPGLPSFGGSVTLAKRAEPQRDRPVVAIDVIGRGTRIVKSDVLKAPTFTLSLLTRSDEEAYSLTSMLSISSVLLLRVPGTRVTDWCYISAGGVREVPVSRVLPPSTAAGTEVQTWAAWEVDCEVTDAPVGGTVGDPTSTWQALKDTGMTWQQLKNKNLTWLQVLKGEFTS